MSARPAGGKPGRLAFVPPRYGEDTVGGAEAVLREAAHGLAARGWCVDVLTTCARDHFTWANEYPAGTSIDGALTVRRFPTVISTQRAERAHYEAAIHAGQRLSIEQQQRWMNDDLRVPELFHFLLDQAGDYDAIVFAPYLFWTTFVGAQVAPERTILMPCLHDEPYAHLEIFEPVFNGALGVWFLSEPEHQLAHQLFQIPQNHHVTGAGVDIPSGYDPVGFRQRHGLGDRRFVLFAGRREGAKGWDGLLQMYERIVARADIPLDLVTMGAVPVRPPAAIADRVIDLGFQPKAERDDAFAAAAAYLQPSQLESFSRTAMEAWLAGTLLIANGASDVVRWHCDRSGAGLTFDDELELEECLRFVVEAPAVAAELAERGRSYVLQNYSWDAVLDRMEATLETWCAS
ncbi:MAG: glycosyltransferase family 4 protein [Acidimicrobiia bacterium]|nr:glycosyltransferase family 4 protein [Acidimicrobiia bacterium]